MRSADKPKVLIVEDLPRWQNMIARFLGSDYTLYFAQTLDEAVNLLDRYFFHVALVDLKLDEKDPENWEGMEVVKRVSQLKHGTQFIVFTSYPTPENVREAAIEYGAFDSIDKAKRGTDATFMRDLVARAVDEAQRIHFGRVESELGITTLIPASLCERETLTELFQIRTLDKLQWLLEQVFRGLCPVRLDPGTFRVDENERRIQAVYWSKAIGIPVLVVIGREESVAEYRPSELVQGGEKRLLTQKHAEHTEPPLLGVVYQLEDANLEHFVDLPLRRTMESMFGGQ